MLPAVERRSGDVDRGGQKITHLLIYGFRRVSTDKGQFAFILRVTGLLAVVRIAKK